MPYYPWLDKNSGKQVIVQRKFKEIDTTPDKDECIEQGMEVEEFATADWERLVSALPHVGEKGKGRW